MDRETAENIMLEFSTILNDTGAYRKLRQLFTKHDLDEINLDEFVNDWEEKFTEQLEDIEDYSMEDEY